MLSHHKLGRWSCREYVSRRVMWCWCWSIKANVACNHNFPRMVVSSSRGSRNDPLNYVAMGFSRSWWRHMKNIYYTLSKSSRDSARSSVIIIIIVWLTAFKARVLLLLYNLFLANYNLWLKQLINTANAQSLITWHSI